MPPLNARAARPNRILSALPRTVLENLLPDLELLDLPVRRVLQQRGRKLDHVTFPLTGVASMVSMGHSGASIEVATVGCEGMVGLPVFLGGESAAVEVFVQVPGEGLGMPVAAFRRHVDREPSLARALLLYTQALLTQIAQSSACNRHHPIVGRCARWLLQTHDRVRGDTFPLTHEFLGLMLGVRRATVTQTAQALQKSSLIRYHRGEITVLDRAGLERAACDCYQLISREYARLIAAMKRTTPGV
jgi:CRP-like cAMP-binding protein